MRTILRKGLHLLLFCIVLCLHLPSAVAQVKNDDVVKVSVVVVDTDGNPLSGANVRRGDKQLGIVAGIDGRAVIMVPKGVDVIFSYVGMKTKTIKVQRAFTGTVVLEDEENLLSQVVVTGYTQTDIRKSTGSVGIISAKELNDSPLKNVDMLLQGKVAGVSVQAVSGRPGESAKVRVRGISSITGTNEPLWVVDDVPLQKNVPNLGSQYIKSGDFSTIYANGIAGINPQNIESVTVLKDASAAAIYGSQAQAGVIVITTKKGKQGRTRVDYSGNVSIQTSPIRDAKLMNSSQKLAYESSIWDEFSAEGFANGTYYPVIGIVGQIRSGYGKYAGWSREEQDAYINQLASHSTDWFEVLFRNTVSTSHNISVSGGTDKQTFFISGGLTTNNGILKRSGSDSYNFTAKINGTPSEKLSYSASADFSYLKSLEPSPSFDIFRYAYYANPYEQLYNADRSYAADETYYSMALANHSVASPLPANGFNVMREINETTLKSSSATTTLRGDITWRAFDGFRLYGLVSTTFANDDSDCEIGSNTYSAWIDRPFEGSQYISSKRIYGSYTQTTNKNLSWLARLQANYSTTINRLHGISAVAGSEVRYNKASSTMGKMYGYDPVNGNHVTPVYLGTSLDGSLTDSEKQEYRNVLNALTNRGLVESAFASFYGAFDYSYNNRYVINATVRSDGSDNFGSKQQFNLTWSTGFAWNIDEEKFFKPFKQILNRATVRLSTGLTGGVNKSVYPQVIMNYSSDYRTSDTEQLRTGFIMNAPNPNLRWEHTQDYNASLDLGFLKDRIGLYLSAYNRRGYDLVTPVQVVSTTGFTTQSYNTTEQVNRGFESTLTAKVLKRKDFSWSVMTNISYNENYISKYNAPNNSLFNSVVLNYPQGAIFSGISTGINSETGIYNYQLRPGVDISQLADSREYRNYVFYIGTTNAPWSGGFSTNITYKDFVLSANTSFSLGSTISNHVNTPSTYSSVQTTLTNSIPSDRNDLYTAHLNKLSEAANRWTPTNPIVNGYPRLIDAHGEYLYLEVDQPTSSNITECVYYESGNYFKLGSVSLIYNIPEKVIRKIGVTHMGISFTGNNLLMITKYSGLNPETPGAVYPISKSFSFGINIGI